MADVFCERSCRTLMKKSVFSFVIFLVLVSSSVVWSAHEAIPYVFDDPGILQWDEPPRVAVSLAGGGARALVNVGVLKALDEAGVPLDLVTGTSMGALVAILYGSGMPVEQMERLVTAVDLSQFFHLNVPFTQSLLDGRRFNAAIEAVVPYKRMEDFPITTAVLSFDLNTGVKYVHTKGPVSEAIQGPYAIPGVFPGIHMDEYFLLDAGIQELAPALAAREMGAQVVITTTAFDELPYTEYGSPIRSWTRMINLIKENYSLPIVHEYSDAVIEFDVGQHSLMDFHLSQMFIDYGYQRTQEELPGILQTLAELGIDLQPRSTPACPQIERVIEDLRRDRLHYSLPVIRPLGYLSWERNFAAPVLFPTAGRYWQLGFGFETGPMAVDLLGSVGIPSLQATARWKKLTAELDAVVAGGLRQNSLWAGGAVQYADSSMLAQTGALWFEEDGLAPFVRGAVSDGWVNGEVMLRGLTVPLAGYAVGQMTFPAFHPWQVQGTAVYRLGEYPLAPMLHRGIELDDVPQWQWSGELIYDIQWEYTKELLQILQFSGMELYQFVGKTSSEAAGLTLGAGARFSLRLLGLKPSSFDGYVAYDIEKKRPTVRFSVDLSF